MKTKQLLIIRYKAPLAAVCTFVFIVFHLNRAYGQFDYESGRNNRGIRISAGIGAAQLNTHFNKNPYKPAYIGNLDYDINPYLSLGLEGQYGTLQGIDDVHHLYYYSSTNKYFSGTANIRVAFGEFNDFESDNAFKDAVKRIYLGVGAGAIRNDIDFKVNSGKKPGIYGYPVPRGKYLLIPINLGTNIDLPGVLGVDRLSINPNFQVNYVNSLYLDGFQSTQSSTLKGFYNITSVKLKYKF